MNINDNYIHNVKINQWAVIEFLNRKKIRVENAKNLKVEHLFLLFGIVRLYINEKTIKKYKNEKEYVLLTDKFLQGNLPFVKCSNRQLKNRIKILENYDFIERYIENENMRYIFVSPILMHLLGYSSIGLSPITQVKKYLTKDFKKLYKDYSNKFKTERLDDLIKTFDTQIHQERYLANGNWNVSLIEVLQRLDTYLQKSLTDAYGYNKSYDYKYK